MNKNKIPALLVTNLIKVGGLGIAVNEVFLRPIPRTLEVILAAFMMAGAQISEETILSLWGKLFVTPEKAPEDNK